MRSVLVALTLVFVAELGDKTQLVALGFGARHRLVPVMTGLVVGYGCVNLLSVAIGGVLGAALPTRAIGIGGGLMFLGFAVWTLRAGSDGDEEEGVPPATTARSVVTTVAVAIFVAELGDKTMLATAALAARNDPMLTWIGATIGIVLAGALGVLLGRAFGTRLPERVARIGAAALFAVFGVVLLVTSVW